MKREMLKGFVSLLSVMILSLLCGQDNVNAQGRPYNFSFPAGWQQVQEAGTVAAALSPDRTVKVTIYERSVQNITAIRLLQERMSQIVHTKVFSPPTDMSHLSTRFNANSVAKMHLGYLRPGDNKKCSHRAFVFVKQNRAVLIEAVAVFEAPEAVFKQADGVIESFRFR